MLVEVHSKDFVIQWVDAPAGAAVQYKIVPLKKSVNFGVFQRLAGHPLASAGTDVPHERDGNAIIEKLSANGLEPFPGSSISRVQANESVEGTVPPAAPGSGHERMLAFVFDNTFSKSTAKTIEFTYDVRSHEDSIDAARDPHLAANAAASALHRRPSAHTLGSQPPHLSAAAASQALYHKQGQAPALAGPNQTAPIAAPATGSPQSPSPFGHLESHPPIPPSAQAPPRKGSLTLASTRESNGSSTNTDEPPTLPPLATAHLTMPGGGPASAISVGPASAGGAAAPPRRRRSTLASSAAQPALSSDGRFLTGVMLKKRRKKLQGFVRRYFSLDTRQGLLNYYLNPGSSYLRGVMPVKISNITVNAANREIFLDSGMEKWSLRAIDAASYDTWSTALSSVQLQGAEDADVEPDVAVIASDVQEIVTHEQIPLEEVEKPDLAPGNVVTKSGIETLKAAGIDWNAVTSLAAQFRDAIPSMPVEQRMELADVAAQLDKAASTLRATAAMGQVSVPKEQGTAEVPEAKPQTRTPNEKSPVSSPVAPTPVPVPAPLHQEPAPAISRNALGAWVGGALGLAAGLATGTITGTAAITLAGASLGAGIISDSAATSQPEQAPIVQPEQKSTPEHVHDHDHLHHHHHHHHHHHPDQAVPAVAPVSPGERESTEEFFDSLSSEEDASDDSDIEDDDKHAEVHFVPQRPPVSRNVSSSSIPAALSPVAEIASPARGLSPAAEDVSAHLGPQHPHVLPAAHSLTAVVEESASAAPSEDHSNAETSLYPLPHDIVRRRKIIPSPSWSPPSLLAMVKKAGGASALKSAPAASNEPITTLQRMAEMFGEGEMLNHASEAGRGTPLRVMYVALFALTHVSVNRCKDRSLRKPFTPLLGETFEMVREDKNFRFVAEKVVHKPLIIASQAESPLWTVHFTSRPFQKLWTKSIQFTDPGPVRVTFSDGENVTFNVPELFLRNILAGERYIDPSGSVTVESSLRQSATIEFKSGGMFSGRSEELHIQSSSDPSLVFRGKWTEGMFHGKKEVWRPQPLIENAPKHYGWTEFTPSLNEVTALEAAALPPTDSRYRPDQLAMEKLDIDSAEHHKANLEQRQRERRAVMEAAKKQHEPSFFTKTNDAQGFYVLHSGQRNYWVRRQAHDWSGIPDYLFKE